MTSLDRNKRSGLKLCVGWQLEMPARNTGVVALQEFSGPVLAPLPQVVPARMRQYCFLPSCKLSRGYEQQPKSTRKKNATRLHCFQPPTCQKPYYAHFDINVTLSQYISVTLSVDIRCPDSKDSWVVFFTY